MSQTYTVADMTCNHCKQAIEAALEPLDNVDRVDVDVDAKQVAVHGSVDPDAVRAAIRDAGYTPS